MRHHTAGLARLLHSKTTAAHILEDFRSATLEPRDRRMLEYADKLTRTPWSVDAQDVDALRSEGFRDQAILHINLTVSYYAYVNRIALGLGVTLEEYWGMTSDE